MKKLLLSLIIATSLYPCGCIDIGTAPELGNQSVIKYKLQDKQVAKEINAIAEDIRESHKKYENESNKRIDDIKLLLAKDLELKKEILFNGVIINKIQGIINTKIATENILKNEKEK